MIPAARPQRIISPDVTAMYRSSAGKILRQLRIPSRGNIGSNTRRPTYASTYPRVFIARVNSPQFPQPGLPSDKLHKGGRENKHSHTQVRDANRSVDRPASQLIALKAHKREQCHVPGAVAVPRT